MTTDKMDTHYHQQLSALMDGDLPPDEARFLLRRLQHDSELTGCWERWQLCGDVLRGQAQAPAPAGFADRVAAAIAAEATQPLTHTSPQKRSSLAKWGGGALAASVAFVALLLVRQQIPDEAPVQATPSVARQSPANPGRGSSVTPALPTAAVTAASVAVASVPRRQAASTQRRSATRTQQAARNPASARAPDRAAAVALASAALPVVHAIASAPANTNSSQRNPFANVQINAPAARPWPRAVLPQYAPGSGAFNTGYSSDRATQSFYPFEPRPPEDALARPPEPVLQDQ